MSIITTKPQLSFGYSVLKHLLNFKPQNGFLLPVKGDYYLTGENRFLTFSGNFPSEKKRALPLTEDAEKIHKTISVTSVAMCRFKHYFV